MNFVLSTASVPAEDRLAYWHEVIGQTYEQLASVRLDLSKLTNAPYTGTITAGRIGPLTVASTVADPLHVRKPGRGELTDDDCLNVCIQDHGHLVIDQTTARHCSGPAPWLSSIPPLPTRSPIPTPSARTSSRYRGRCWAPRGRPAPSDRGTDRG